MSDYTVEKIVGVTSSNTSKLNLNGNYKKSVYSQKRGSQKGFLLPMIPVLVLLFIAPLSALTQRIDLDKGYELSQMLKTLLSFSRTFDLRQSTSGNAFSGLYRYLPCPGGKYAVRDDASDCFARSSSNYSIGSVPWFTLGLQKPKKLSKCYWLLVPGNVHQNSLTINTLHNADIEGKIYFNGSRGVAAVIESIDRIRVNQFEQCNDERTLNALNEILDLPTAVKSSLVLDELGVNVRLITAKQLFADIYTNNSFKRVRDEFAQSMLTCLSQRSNSIANDTHNGLPAAFINTNIANGHKISNYREGSESLGWLPILDAKGNSKRDELIYDCDYYNLNVAPLDRVSGSTTSAHRRFWMNWKDHWFWRVSVKCGVGGECVEYKGKSYMAILLFAGEKLDSQTRPSSDLSDYLEEPFTAHGNSNDVAYCLDIQHDIVIC